MTIYYAGIGSRETPNDIMVRMSNAAQNMENRGYILRSGGAAGADTAFEEGVVYNDDKEIYLPWKDFNKRQDYVRPPENSLQQAMLIASKFHPGWRNLSQGAQALMIRNVFQITGLDTVGLKTLSSFVLCWTPDGANGSEERPTTRHTGGTGQAIRIANSFNIPVFNMKFEEDIIACKAFVDSIDQLKGSKFA